MRQICTRAPEQLPPDYAPSPFRELSESALADLGRISLRL